MPASFHRTLILAIPVIIAAWTVGAAPVPRAGRVETLESIAALPPHITGTFREPAGFARTRAGDYLVFDRGAHSVHRVSRDMSAVTELVKIGHEPGRVIQPAAFSAAPDGSFVVADTPTGRQRIQVFTADGQRLNGFLLPGRAPAFLSIAGTRLRGIGSLHYTGNSILLNQPETGSLIVEYSLDGRVLRTVGTTRATGFEADSEVHLALNAGLPLAHPRGGYYFVFHAGEPRFRRYTSDGALQYERVVQGPELDQLLAARPTRWPVRRDPGETPLVLPAIRTAAVDDTDHLWVSLVPPFTYVYDRDGEKARTVQFRAAGVIAPAALSFTRERLLVAPGLYVFDPRNAP